MVPFVKVTAVLGSRLAVVKYDPPVVVTVFHVPLVLLMALWAMPRTGVCVSLAPEFAPELVSFDPLDCVAVTSRVGVPVNPSNSSYSRIAVPGEALAAVPAQVQVSDLSVPTAMA